MLVALLAVPLPGGPKTEKTLEQGSAELDRKPRKIPLQKGEMLANFPQEIPEYCREEEIELTAARTN